MFIPKKIAIVHDYLVQAGGAERVVEAMHDLWPDAPIYTSVYDPATTLPSFRQMDIRTSFLQRLKFARQARTHKYALPLFPLAFEHFDMRGYDVVLSHTTSFAKGVITDASTCHICYCHTPSRFAWRYHEYISEGNYGTTINRALPFIVHFLRMWDQLAANRVDYFISNSRNIARRVKKYYKRESEILYPPVETQRFFVEPSPSTDYYLIVSRLLYYKRVDLAVRACTRKGLPLKVVGTGPEMDRLRQIAGPTIEFLGRVPDGQVEKLFANCKAFFFPGEEDFGIAPLEAMASGRPVIAYGAGGALETVIDGVSGVFFREPKVESVMGAMERLDALHLDPMRIRTHAEQFDIRRFQARLQNLVESYATHYHENMYGVPLPLNDVSAEPVPEDVTRSASSIATLYK